jgi:putative addiction module component (TIGR02574 family)
MLDPVANALDLRAPFSTRRARRTREDLARRLAETDADPMGGSPAEEVFERIRNGRSK